MSRGWIDKDLHMILSIVIVSYNVKFFLEQCLSSLKKAVEGITLPGGSAEVFIVDNASSDGSPDFLEPLFPDFHFIRNKENFGFAKANNQVLSLCTGEFVLFLNPDTILAENVLDICISFSRDHPDAGALGVRMVDGAGRFLKESKRGFPGSAASFFKMSGLARLFPRSKIFSAYYMGHLQESSPHAVDILSGAFMLVKKTVLDRTEGFDEQFFMYAEDIDLSYLINQAGFKNYYLPEATIIHFKGESTRKNFGYVKMFYSAMQLFMKKHFKGGSSSLQLFILNIGMQFRQALAFTMLPFKKSERNSKTRMPVFIKGDPGNEERLKMKMIANHIPVSENENNGAAIIFCESDHRSWKTIIAEITNKPGRLIYYFHGSGTHSAVSSYSNRKQGDVIEL
jgi:N-acetylglucosaminyl-diphospho-decaprenol L-rhamnosyltransferase